MHVRHDQRLAQHLDHRDRRADAGLEAQLHARARGGREELGPAPRDELLVRRDDALAAAEQLRDVRAGRLDAAHHLGDDGDRVVVGDRREVGRQHAVRGGKAAVLLDVAHERLHHAEPVAGRPLDVVCGFDEEPVHRRADRAVARAARPERQSTPCASETSRCCSPRNSRPTTSICSLAERSARRLQVDLADVHLGDPLARERPVADLAEHLAHVLAHVLVDHLRAARVAAVLGGVGDRVVHPLDAALVDQVDDQLHLVQALVVGDLGRVAGLDERLEAQVDQLRDAAAEHGLLAEEVGLGLLGERSVSRIPARPEPMPTA